MEAAKFANECPACRLGVSEGTSSPCVETPIRSGVASSATIVCYRSFLPVRATCSSVKTFTRNPSRESQLRLADTGSTAAASLSSGTSDQ